jgi:hypothetical protein
MPADNNKRPNLPRIASYSATNGRATSVYARIEGETCHIEGENCTPWAPQAKGQPRGGSPSWDEIDKARCQGGSVKDRPQG